MQRTTDVASFFNHVLYGDALINEMKIKKLRFEKNRFGGSLLFI
jgi:hypothetical protein